MVRKGRAREGGDQRVAKSKTKEKTDAELVLGCMWQMGRGKVWQSRSVAAEEMAWGSVCPSCGTASEEGHGRISYRVYGVDIAHIEDVCGGLLGESMGHEEFIFTISNSLEEFHCFPFLVYGVNSPYVHTHYAQLSLTRSGPGRLLAHRWLLVLLLTVFSVFINFPHLGHMVC